MLEFPISPFLILIAFVLKHLVVDFFLQGPWMYLNKGTYGHPGGIMHSVYHVFSSWLIFVILEVWLFNTANMLFVYIIIFAEGFIHYHMDWFKMWWCKRQNYKAHTDLGCTLKQAHWFWWWVGIDQTVHILTYMGMVWIYWHAAIMYTVFLIKSGL